MHQILTNSRPSSERSMLAGSSDVIPWDEARDQLANSDAYWLATVSDNGRPHVVRILAVWAEGAMHFCTSPASQKGQNLGDGAPCALSTDTGVYDLILNGDAIRILDETVLQTIADAYKTKYGWNPKARDGAFHDTEGAPTAGPPPYHVYAISPRVAFGYGASNAESFAPTRWGFAAVDK